MILEVFELIGAIIVILIGCELFANAIEHIGRKFALSHAATGSLLAAIGTAMPETIIPILALIFGGDKGEEIGIGAILGAPFMLLTLAILFVAVTAIIMKFMKKRDSTTLNVNVKAITFDLKFFIFAFILVIIGSLAYNQTHNKLINYAIAVFLIIWYIYYIKTTLKHDFEAEESYEEFFYFAEYFSVKPTITNVYLQTILGLIIIIFGTKLFVGYLIIVGTEIGISMLVLSLLITPIATELPEKYNSVTWTLKKKDTLAFANITGAVAFQSTIVVSIGLILTEWHLDSQTLMTVFFALLSGILIYATLKIKKKLYAEPLLIGGVFYIAYILITLSSM